MLDDRSYMRSQPRRFAWSMTVILLIANTVLFVLQSVAEFYFTFPIAKYFALSIEGLQHGFVWQLITFQFLHGNLVHLLGNLLVIYFFGQPMEEALGRASFLRLYFISGFAGGLLQMAFAFLIPLHFGGAVMGASAGAAGLLAAFASWFPDRQITLLLFFVIPISLRARTLLWVSMGMAIFGMIIPDSHIAHAAHLGGILTGVAYAFFVVRGTSWILNWTPSRRRPVRLPRELVNANSLKQSPWRSSKNAAAEDLAPAEFISREVDPILDKISAHGIHSLTDRERQILEAARARMAKR